MPNDSRGTAAIGDDTRADENARQPDSDPDGQRREASARQRYATAGVRRVQAEPVGDTGAESPKACRVAPSSAQITGKRRLAGADHDPNDECRHDAGRRSVQQQQSGGAPFEI
uniref:(northern house mosquito) hypothetical protein n=1 Tax=Culex pipiens TaxID=7175 RepID=A0A8D8MIA3_CULPI